MSERQAIIVCGLGYGDEGKGSVVDHLTRVHGAHTVIRFNGGPQAAHNVVTPDGRWHTFSQWGAGTLAGASTLLGPDTLVNPLNMLREAEHLRGECVVLDVWGRLAVHERCLVITPFHQAMNRLREVARGDARHGTCGEGVGEAVADVLAGWPVLRFGDLDDPQLILYRLRELCARYLREFAELGIPASRWRDHDVAPHLDFLAHPNGPAEVTSDLMTISRLCRVVDDGYVADLLASDGTVIFEGAQGVLLDEWHGWHPYTTWSTTTFDNAQRMLDAAGYAGEVTRLGVVRSYATRHGPGPFVTEDQRLAEWWPEAHNGSEGDQGAFRVGWFDLVATRYAVEVARPTALAMTHLDRAPAWRVCDTYLSPDGELSWRRIPPKLEEGFALTDLARQERLAALMMVWRPHYVDGPRIEYHAEDFARYLAASLGLPLLLTSHGPTTAEKCLHGALMVR
jgi:adenylosuccinate synthase